MNKAEFEVYARDNEYEVQGKLRLHSETGTEGGYWAIQDGRYIKKVVAVDGVFDGQSVFDPADTERSGRVLMSMREDGSKFEYDSTQKENVARTVVEWEDGAEEARLSTDLLVERCSYDGLITLKVDDELTIYEKFEPSKIAWQGLVKLIQHNEGKSDELEHPFRLHHDQNGVDQNEWAGWFLNQYPANLVRPDGFWSVQPVNGPFLPRGVRFKT